MMTTAYTLDLSRLPAFQLVDADYGRLLAQHLAAYREEWEVERQRRPELPSYDVGHLAFDPIAIAIQEYSHQRMLDLQALNDAGKGLTLAYGWGSRLDHVAVTYHRTQRLVLQPATGNQDAVMESDAALKARAQLAPEARARYGITGGGYIYAILTAFPGVFKDIRPIPRGGGGIELRLLAAAGDGSVSNALLADVIRLSEPEGGNLSTDIVTVYGAEIEHRSPRLTLLMPRGPDPELVKAAARKTLVAYRDEVHRLNGRVYPDALQSAAKVGPVVSVRLAPDFVAPVQRATAAPYLDDFDLQTEFVDG